MRYERSLDGGMRLTVHSLQSEVLQDNPLGDPALRHCPLLLPPGSPRGLPLVLVLVGFTGSGPRVLNVSMWQENLPERIARLTREKALPPAVWLWPSCETRLGGSQYRNSTATGRYEDFLVQELVPAVEGEHECGGRAGRVLVGKSSGGYGALTLCMRNPDFAVAVGSHAGDMGFELGYWCDFPAALTALKKHGGPERFLEELPRLRRIGTPEVHAADLLAMSACYSPNPGAPLGFDLPVDLETGEPQQEVFRRWLESDPLRMVENQDNLMALSRLRALYLDAGEEDEFGLQWALRRFLRRIEAAGVRHRAEFFPGGHFDLDWRYEVSLPYLLEAVT